MTRDYAKRPKRPAARNTRRQPSRKTLPGWLWLVSGILVGALVMTVIHHSRDPGTPQVVETRPGPVAEPDNGAPRPRFDFYTLLKESESILGEDETPPPQSAALPSPTLPPATQPEVATEEEAAPSAPTRNATAATDTSPASPPAIVEQAPLETPPPAPAPTPAPQPRTAAAGEVYLLQAGSFKSAEDADNLRVRLLLLNMQARVETVSPRPGETWHRVQVGPFDNTQSLANARSVLQQNGIASIQVRKTQ